MMCADEVHELYYIIVKIRSDRLNGCCSIFPHSISECDQTFVSRNGGPQNGTFTAPVMNNLSNHSRQCLYIFLAGPGQRVEITFTTFNLRGTPPEYVFDSLIYLRLAWTPLALCMRAPGEKNETKANTDATCVMCLMCFSLLLTTNGLFSFSSSCRQGNWFFCSLYLPNTSTRNQSEKYVHFLL